MNGKKLLVGANANERPLFVPRFITTEADFAGWLPAQSPNLLSLQINSILAANPNSANTDPAGPRFETNGLSSGGVNAVNVSADSNDQQQRGNNIYAEDTFHCPACWMASAYSGGSKAAYQYQY